jgi:hypothetical protein
MLNRKEILKKKKMLSNEIEFLLNQRETSNDTATLNKKIQNKKNIYNFYNNLLKRM